MKKKLKKEPENPTTGWTTQKMIEHMDKKLEELKERTRQIRRERGLPG